ncbi:MAG TPA: CAP domain-containing protein [Sporichthyaceae bacterium]|jgi:uncharacterized protein YkwD|nr:CAP domain-containing protein [Sporichthyaceae bacterium]
MTAIRGVRTAAWALTAATGVTLLSPTTAQAASGQSALQRTVIALVNAQRTLAGCSALSQKANLDHSAVAHAAEMSTMDYFSHSSYDGTTWYNRIKSFGVKYPGGENIAAGFFSATTVMTAWMNSPGHRANILDCQFKSIGVGQAANGGYWVEDFSY